MSLRWDTTPEGITLVMRHDLAGPKASNFGTEKSASEATIYNPPRD